MLLNIKKRFYDHYKKGARVHVPAILYESAHLYTIDTEAKGFGLMISAARRMTTHNFGQDPYLVEGAKDLVRRADFEAAIRKPRVTV